MRSIAIKAAILAVAACSGGNDQNGEETGVAEPTADSASPETLEGIPAAFQGRWDFAEEDCANDASEMRLNIAADQINYFESSAVPETITQTEPDTLTITHLFSGEGEEWTETLAYTLSEDGERLTVTSPDGSMSIRMRCPA